MVHMLTIGDDGFCEGKRARRCRRNKRHNSRLRSKRRMTHYQVLVRSQHHVLCSVSFANSTGTSLDSDGKEKIASPDPSGED